MRAYAHDKAERLGVFASNAHRIDAVLSQPNAHTYQAELTANLPGSDALIVRRQHQSFLRRPTWLKTNSPVAFAAISNG